MNRINNKLLLAVAITLALSNTVMAEDTKTKDPLTGPVANARQEAQIWTTYALNPYLSATDLNVSVQQGVVTLSGNVADDVHKELAGAIAAGVRGIKDVENNIIVDEEYKKPVQSSRGYADVVSDATITAAVKSKLLWSKHTDGMDTKVITKDGKVELSGIVATKQAKQQAEKLAMNTDGVRAVSNQLEVSNTTAKGKGEHNIKAEQSSLISDSWITTKVKSTFMYSSNVAGADISVNTEKGIVTLAGTVSSGVEQALAIELAQNIRGVKSVSSKQLVF